ncbi:MAG: GNAT family N-acetyltransferase [Clostridiales bacterium]|nr:GNAT family N-acetyltransferase [Clostridiales bacterium]
MIIYKGNEEDIPFAQALCNEIFLRHIGCNTAPLGIAGFLSFVYDRETLKKLDIYYAKENDSIIGILAFDKERNHLSLFFVKTEYQGKGVGKKLFEQITPFDKEFITVNSSVNSEPIYKSLGFYPTRKKYPLDANGLKYIPMIYHNKYKDLSFESLGQEIEICVSSEHRFGTDAFLLADFASPRNKDEVCDYCSGSGIIALLMKRNFSPKMIYAVEIQEKAVEQMKLSVLQSNISDFKIISGDLKDFKAEKELDLITCNPPYKINNTGAKNELEAVSIARHEIMCSLDDVCLSAKKNLKFGGRLCICNRPERLCDIMVSMRNNNIEPKRVRFVSKNPKTAPWLVLVEGKKGANSYLQVEPQLYTQGENSLEYSDEMKRIYKID